MIYGGISRFMLKNMVLGRREGMEWVEWVLSGRFRKETPAGWKPAPLPHPPIP